MRLVAREHSHRLSLTEWAVLALLAEHPVHPFALARNLAPDGDLGHVFTVRRPLVYRALDRLVSLDLARSERTEPGDAGPTRTIRRITDRGREDVDRWLQTPVYRVRDLRIEFILKAELLRRSGRPTARLVDRQRVALDDRLARLESLPPQPDAADLWRHHNAGAARAFLNDRFWQS